MMSRLLCGQRVSGCQGGERDWVRSERQPNDSRPKFLALLADQSISLIVVEHKDRGTRFGFRSIETLLTGQGREIEVVNQADHGTEDLLADLVSLLSRFCARLYGQRRAKRKTEKIAAA